MQRDGAIIYVAGNPDLYPVEYYDAQSQTYQGAVPALLADFARAYGYDLRYFQPGAEDRRDEFAANQQVDLISGCEAGDRYLHTAGEPLLLFTSQSDGAETAYALFLTQVSPASLQSDLRAYAAQITQAQWTGALLEAAGEAPPAQLPIGALVGGGLAALSLLAALAVSLVCLRREKKRRARREQTDPETGLGTVGALADSFSRIVRDQSRGSYNLVCIHLDLDQIGRLRGYERAKELLRLGAQALRQAAEPGDVPARCGPDLLALRRAPDPQQAARWAEEVLERIRAGSPRVLRPQDAAAGIYPLSGEILDFDHALFHAGQCARAACREAQDSRLCGTEQCRECRQRWNVLDDLSAALERNEFQLYLQFFVSAGSFRVVGAEALSRWYHPRLGLLPPARYVPLLEEADRIRDLDFYGLEKVCAFLQELDQRGIRDFFISCNFARRTISMPDFAQRCTGIVRRHAFARKLLILEVTESQSLSHAEDLQMLQNIQAVRRFGIRVIFDDFGAGFSSFHDLQGYPMDGLKLDKELVDNMQTERGRILLHALVDAGHRMGLTILAEGVEEDSQIAVLQELRCDAFQGYRFSVPLPEAEARRRILEGKRSLRDQLPGQDGAQRGAGPREEAPVPADQDGERTEEAGGHP